MVAPRRMKRPARVTMNDGSPRADHDRTVDVADHAGDRKGEQDAEPERPAQLRRRDRHDHPGGADHRADREIKLAADHQHAGGDRNDPELGRHLEEIDDAERREHAGAARDDREEGEHQDGPSYGAELGAGKSPADPGRLFERSSMVGAVVAGTFNLPRNCGTNLALPAEARRAAGPSRHATSECPSGSARSPGRRCPW